MKIYKTDDPITALAKRGAMICNYAICNPFHVSFEDRNFSKDWNLNFERKYNERYREKNGDLMFQFIREFIDELDALSRDDRMAVYRLTRKKWDYLAQKWDRKIKANSRPVQRGFGCCYHHYLDSDGHIYVETDLGVKLRQF